MKNIFSLLVVTAALTSCSSSNSNPPPDSDSLGDSAVTVDANTVTDTTVSYSPAKDPVTQTAVALDIVGQGLLVSLAGFQADRLSLFVRDLAVEIEGSGEPMPLSESSFETLDGFGPAVVVSPTQKSAYTCSAGGQMIHETGRLRRNSGEENSLRGDYDVFTFDDCRHVQTTDVFAAGDYRLNGNLVMEANDYSVMRGSHSGHANSWTEFTMSVPADIAYEISGNIEFSAYSAAYFGSGDSRTANLSIYKKTSGTQTIESLEDVRFSLIRTIPNGSDDSGYQLDTQGISSGPATGSVLVTINTDQVLSGLALVLQGIIEPFSGQIRMVAADGGELTLSANPESQISGVRNGLLVDFVALRPDGDSVIGDAVPLIDIHAAGVNNWCFINIAG